MVESGDVTKVIIVGAGMAGLAAAQYLKSIGISFVLLEGSGRVGGRLCSKQWRGITIELGAVEIQGCSKANPIFQIGSTELKLKGH